MDNFKSLQSPMSPHNFWQSVNILLTKFNVINKRLWSSNILHRHVCKAKSSNWIAPLETLHKISNEDHNIIGYLQYFLKHFNLSFAESECNSNYEILVIELLPKKFTEKNAFQLVCLDKNNIIATFYDISPRNLKSTSAHSLCPNFTYSLALENEKVTLRIATDFSPRSQKWLMDTVLPQFVKWGRDDTKPRKALCIESLQLISTDKYYKKYYELKQKYGKEMVENWPEVTDPSKFVYEDVAIATYLLLLWENDGVSEMKSFVDLGCGNGLLVYILTKEGHKGTGIDVRKRRIWDQYPKDINLEVKTITPSDSNLFPDADWLIGNHSDELTPWIPVIACKSSYKCNFFLLPCCAYNFDGTKYQRKDSSKSQYTEYIEYVKTICESCGFETSIDRLKIPSTKRICLVGHKKTYPAEKHVELCMQIQNFVDKESTSSNGNHASWVSDFQPRNPVERVRNCTQIDRTVIDNVIGCISKYLLQDCYLGTIWSAGKEVNIHEVIPLLSEDDLKAMKAECGGLQTLLKNNHHIFEVHSGKVRLRYPRTIDEVRKSSKKRDKSNIKVQQKICWFYNNHPKGCPLTDATCSYLHVIN